jgi:dTDP-4-dehydrorhamnose reductase
MIKQDKLLVTGSSGLLGTELKKLLPTAHFTDIDNFDVTKPDMINRYLDDNKIETVLHAAAFMPPMKSDKNPAESININIVGTANVAMSCIKRNIRLVYISTDYVFKGDEGNYKEEDPVYPPNKYAWSKLGGECAVRLYDNSVIIRTSFGPKTFPYPKAFEDQWTSKEPVDKIAKKIAKVVNSDFVGIIHLGGEKKTVFEYSRQLPNAQEVEGFSRKSISGYNVPKDTSLNTDKYKKLFDS